MFTGIITHIGKVEKLTKSKKNDLLLEISVTQKISRKLDIGCSIACSGICLTLVSHKKSRGKNIFSFCVSKETCDKTTVGDWQIGDEINVEFSLRLGDELGGHIVLGHVDGTAQIKALRQIKDSKKITFFAEKNLLKFIAKKGCIALNGVSLTVNEVDKKSFSVNLISHTLAHTTFKNAALGQFVNLEIDSLIRYAKLRKNF